MNSPVNKDVELHQFHQDLIQSARELRAGKGNRVTQVEVAPVVKVRLSLGLSQSQFAHLLGVSKRTLQGWEQGKIQPSGAARTLISVAEKYPEILRELITA
jgi:putative transcriptional regulator